MTSTTEKQILNDGDGRSSGGRKRLVKLVRDGVGKFGDGGVSYEPLDGEDLAVLLRQKLLEEVGEYLIDPSLAELADVYEVVRALAIHDLGLQMRFVEQEADTKRHERGAFRKGTGMYVFSTAPDRHEGNNR